MPLSEQNISELNKIKEFVNSQIKSKQGEIFGLYGAVKEPYSNSEINECRINQLTRFLYYDECYFDKPREDLFLENRELNQPQLNSYLHQILEKEAYLQYRRFEGIQKQLEEKEIDFSKADLSSFHWNQAVEKIAEFVSNHSYSEIK